jgi:hypothetical protein
LKLRKLGLLKSQDFLRLWKMNEKASAEPKRKFFIANVPGCCDPNKPFKPLFPNDCQTCRKHADYTCWDWFPEGPKGKLKFKREAKNEER